MNKKDRRNAGLADTCTECTRQRNRDSTITKKRGLTKRCRKCGERGPFYKAKSSTDGMMSMCVSCHLAVVKKWSTSEHGKKMRDDSIKKHKSGPDGRKRQARTMAKHRARNPEKAKARNAIASAISSGAMERPTRCSVNNSNCHGEIQAHHEDYSRPLDVIWLCRFHHLEVHRAKENESRGAWRYT